MPVFAGLLGVLVCVLLHRLYPVPVLTADAASYLTAARGEWGRYYRTPAYGYLLEFALSLHWLSFVTWVQAGMWCLMIVVVAAVAGTLLRSSLLGGFVALGVLFYDVQEMSLLPYHWHLLTESLVADGIIIGCAALVMAGLRRSAWWLTVACLLLGIVVWIRPLPYPVLLALPFFPAVFRFHSKDLYSLRQATFAFALLVVPLLSVMAYNIAHFGSFSPSPIGGLDAVTYTEALYRDGDQVYDDPETNDAFASVMRDNTMVRPDFVGFPVERSEWAVQRAFFDEQVGVTHPGERVFAIAAESQNVFRTLIMLHPEEYARLFLGKVKSILINDSEDDLPWRDGFEGVVDRQLFLLSQASPRETMLFRGYTDPAFARADPTVVHKLNRVRFFSDHAFESVWMLTVQAALVILALLIGAWNVCAADPYRRALGTFILLLLAAAACSIVVTASVVLIPSDARYRAGPVVFMTIAALLALADVWTRVRCVRQWFA